MGRGHLLILYKGNGSLFTIIKDNMKIKGFDVNIESRNENVIIVHQLTF